MEDQTGVDLAERVEKKLKELADRLEDNPKAVNFVESVLDRAEGIMRTIKMKGYCTTNQIHALENMRAGLEKWVR
jgi:hypothetical protein